MNNPLLTHQRYANGIFVHPETELAWLIKRFEKDKFKELTFVPDPNSYKLSNCLTKSQQKVQAISATGVIKFQDHSYPMRAILFNWSSESYYLFETAKLIGCYQRDDAREENKITLKTFKEALAKTQNLEFNCRVNKFQPVANDPFWLVYCKSAKPILP